MLVLAATAAGAGGAPRRVTAYPSGWDVDAACGAEADPVVPGGTARRALRRRVARPARAELVRAEITTGVHLEIRTEKNLAWPYD
ncbi:hypothetical protein [Parafrankia elaeagni]|uniref:hypothetical protein n=1 Tax=Parafrankia elaeagni TaxID=222534 RepID=UPI0012B60A0D|nr:hypothetical protein [Parafrankia elaeagni]